MSDQPPADAAPEPPPAQPIEPNDLNIALVKALGLDDDRIGGFRLDVTGGAFPVLQVWFTPPDDGEGLTDQWVGPMADATAGAQYVMLPGGDAEAPQVQLRAGMSGFPPDQLAATLDAMADILNGAGCTPELREALTAQAHAFAADIRRLARVDLPMVNATDVARMLRGSYNANNLQVLESLHGAGLAADVARSVEVATREAGS